MLITPAYQQLQAAFHVERQDYGANAHRWADRIRSFADQLGTRDILDYGAGKGSLQRALPFPIKQYDPAMPEFAAPPNPADFVVCLDVLEHIEPECLDDVLAHMGSLTRKMLLAEIATRPAKKFLPDGRNAHLIQQHSNWWLLKLMQNFMIQSIQWDGQAMHVLAWPLVKPAPEMEVHIP
jgi:hypothetical protein